MHNTLVTTLFVGFLFLFSSCSSTSTTSSTTNKADSGEYLVLSNKSITSFVGKKVCIEGELSEIVHQHMMKSSLNGEEKHIYIDYNDGSQTTGYYSTIKVPNDKKTHKFYGTVQKMSGAGKGGGTHTEYYIDLDKVE